MESHPFEPYYISAVAETKVLLYQYGTPNYLHQFNCREKPNAKILHMQFSDHGNKFGLMDESGCLDLFLFNTTSHLKPYFHQECHNKFGSGFCFLGSSSLIATCGHSSEGLYALFF
uniref:DmX-like protein 1 (Trinotate prediction) n=1 Tax=Myxobolus squamalis TaxID=59785 RepID=A0A6B2GEL4_MYXSQ